MADPPVTLKDVAARARVHPATASRALNPETRLLVREDTAQRVLEAAAALGYRPNTVARSLRTRRSHSVGVLTPGPSIRTVTGSPAAPGRAGRSSCTVTWMICRGCAAVPPNRSVPATLVIRMAPS